MAENVRKYDVYVGTYAAASADGVFRYQLEVQGGQCRFVKVGAWGGIENPSYIEFDAAKRVLYAVSETGEGRIESYRVAADGGLTRTGAQSTHGGAPCHIVLGRGPEEFLVVANYSGGNAALFPLDEQGGILPAAQVIQHSGHGVNPERQEGPHPHSAWIDPGARYVLVPDLGIDRIVVYAIAHNPLQLVRHGEVELKPGAGPRHFAFHPSGSFGYGMNELDATVTAFAYDAGAGTLTEIQTVSALPVGFDEENLAAHVVVSSDGKFLYASNRGHDSIAVFAIHPGTGLLTLVQHESTHGSYPRNFALTPDGAYLLAANQGSDSITVFAVDGETGRIEFTGCTVSVPKPTCIQFR